MDTETISGNFDLIGKAMNDLIHEYDLIMKQMIAILIK
jgi:hypothetical protein